MEESPLQEESQVSAETLEKLVIPMCQRKQQLCGIDAKELYDKYGHHCAEQAREHGIDLETATIHFCKIEMEKLDELEKEVAAAAAASHGTRSAKKASGSKAGSKSGDEAERANLFKPLSSAGLSKAMRDKAQKMKSQSSRDAKLAKMRGLNQKGTLIPRTNMSGGGMLSSGLQAAAAQFGFSKSQQQAVTEGNEDIPGDEGAEDAVKDDSMDHDSADEFY